MKYADPLGASPLIPARDETEVPVLEVEDATPEIERGLSGLGLSEDVSAEGSIQNGFIGETGDNVQSPVIANEGVCLSRDL